MHRRAWMQSVLTFGPWLAGMWFVYSKCVSPWMHRIDLKNALLSILCDISAAIWFAVLGWASYHLLCQIRGALTRTITLPAAQGEKRTQFFIFYLTCDDFQPVSAKSCLMQDYPARQYQVAICDDSTTPHYIDLIRTFVAEGRKKRWPRVLSLRRPDRVGFKAGNLNHAFDTLVDIPSSPADWVVVVDADQVLPTSFLRDLDRVCHQAPASVGFVQTMNCSATRLQQANSSKSATPFQFFYGFEIDVFYERDLRARSNFGFMPFLGHGGAIRSSVWKTVRFPLVVSEDFAFTIKCINQGFRGLYVPAISSYEAYPRDFSSFVTRLCKFTAGTAELLKEPETRRFLRCAPMSQRVDFLLLLGWYPLVTLLLLNLYVSAFVCYRLNVLGFPILHPALPYFFFAMFAVCIGIYWTVGSLARAVSFWFRSVTLYQSTLPLVASTFIYYAVCGRRPQFLRTPKDDSIPRHSSLDSMMVGLGTIGLALAAVWPSPFSFVVASHSIAQAAFPLLRWVNGRGVRGYLAKAVLLVPGILLLLALLSMWVPAKFYISPLIGR